MRAVCVSTGLQGSQLAPSGSFAKALDDKAAAQAPHPRRRGWRPRQPAKAFSAACCVKNTPRAFPRGAVGRGGKGLDGIIPR